MIEIVGLVIVVATAVDDQNIAGAALANRMMDDDGIGTG